MGTCFPVFTFTCWLTAGFTNNLISVTVQNAGEQKTEMEELKRQVAKENEQLEKRKKAIDVELSEIEPLVQVIRGVFNNYNQHLSKIVNLCLEMFRFYS